MTDYRANPEMVLQILQKRAQEDSFIREVLRGAVLEAALIEATQDEEPAQEDV